MDPLSIIASIAGISQAGASLSREIYNLISSVRGAPKEISDIARGISDLSIILRELRNVLKEGRDVYSRKLLRRVGSSGRRIGKIHLQINQLLAIRNGIAQLKWFFRKSKVTQLLYQIESHKSGINIILHTMVLGAQLKQLSKRSQYRLDFTNDVNDNHDDDADIALTRHQAENMVQNSYYSLQSLVAVGQTAPQIPVDDDNKHEDESDGEVSNNRVEVRNEQSDDTAVWLYDLVFSTAIEACDDAELIKPVDSSSHGGISYKQEPKGPNEISESNSDPSVVAFHKNTRSELLQVISQRSPPVASVVNELLSEWTTLTEDEIEGNEGKEKGKEKRKENEDNDMAKIKRNESSIDKGVQMVPLTCAVGRKFRLPFHLIQKWSGLTELINEMYLNVDMISPLVRAGCYDIIGSEGQVILPSLWEYSIHPKESLTMAMWSLEERLPEQSRPQAQPQNIASYPQNSMVPESQPPLNRPSMSPNGAGAQIRSLNSDLLDTSPSSLATTLPRAYTPRPSLAKNPVKSDKPVQIPTSQENRYSTNDPSTSTHSTRVPEEQALHSKKKGERRGVREAPEKGK